MEVSLIDARGLPAGCVLSLKAGSTRRQGVADPDKLRLAFPKRHVDEHQLKVDLLAPIGSAWISLTHDQERYDVAIPSMDDAAPFEVSLRVCSTGGAGKAEAGPISDKPHGVRIDSLPEKVHAREPETSSRRHLMALHARAYLDQHNLITWWQKVFQTLVAEQPDDPWQVIGEQVGSYTRTAPVAEDAAVAVEGAPEQIAAELKAKVRDATVRALTLEEAAKQETRTSLMPVVKEETQAEPAVDDADESKASAPREPEDDAVEHLRATARDILLDAAANGYLVVAINEAVTATSQLAEASATEESAKMMAELRDSLTAACDNGTLNDMIGSAFGASGEEEEGKAVSDADEVRKLARDAFGEACSDGRLVVALSGLREEVEGKSDAVQQFAAVEDAAEDGEEPVASEAGASAKGEDATLGEADALADSDVEALRQQALLSIAAACADGRLEQTLTKLQGSGGQGTDEAEEDLESLRLRARGTFCSGSSRLPSVLRNVGNEEESEAAAAEDDELIRDEAMRTLVEAANTGELREILQTIGHMDDTEDLVGEEEAKSAPPLQPADAEGEEPPPLPAANLLDAARADIDQGEEVEARPLPPMEEEPPPLPAADLLDAARADMDQDEEVEARPLPPMEEEGVREDPEVKDDEAVEEDDAPPPLPPMELKPLPAEEEEPDFKEEGDADLNELRLKAMLELTAAAQDGRFDVVLKEVETQVVQEEAVATGDDETDIDALRQRAMFALTDAATNGILAKIMSEPKADATKDCASSGDELDVEVLRQEARKVLTEAASDGRLVCAIGLEPIDDAKTDPHDDDAAAVESVKSQAREILTRAASDGTLEKRLELREEDTPDDEMEALREQAMNAFAIAATTGHLDELLARTLTGNFAEEDAAENDGDGEVKVPQQQAEEAAAAPDTVEALRQQAMEILARAANDGRLEEVLEITAPRDTAEVPGAWEDAIEEGAAASGEADEDGDEDEEAEALREEEPNQADEESAADPSAEDDMDALREQAMLVICRAATDGRLEAVLGAAPLTTVEEEREESTSAVPAEDSVESLRAQAMRIIANAAADGRLEAALGIAPSKDSIDANPEDDKGETDTFDDDDVEVLREQAMRAISRAATDGRLEAVLEGAATRDTLEEDAEADEGTGDNDELQGESAGKDPMDADEVEALREQAMEILSMGSSDRPLEAVPESASREDDVTADDEVEALRAQAMWAITTAASDGRLEAILEGPKPIAAWEAGDADERSAESEELGNDEVEALREQAMMAISTAVTTGRLEALLSGQEDLEDKDEAAPPENLAIEEELPLTGGGVDIVVAGLTVHGLDYGRLMEQEDVRFAFEAEVRRSLIAEYGGQITEEDIVGLELSPGSVKVKVTIRPRAEVPAAKLTEHLATSASASSLAKRVASSVSAVPGIAAVVEEGRAIEVSGVTSVLKNARPQTPHELREAREKAKLFQEWTQRTTAELKSLEEEARRQYEKTMQAIHEQTMLVNAVNAAQAEPAKASGHAQVHADDSKEEAAPPPDTDDEAMPTPPRHSAWGVEGQAEVAEEERATAVAERTLVEAVAPATLPAMSVVVEEATEDIPVSPVVEVTRKVMPAGAGTDPLAMLEQVIRERNERFKRENEALRNENLRLRGLRQLGEETRQLDRDNQRLREDNNTSLFQPGQS